MFHGFSLRHFVSLFALVLSLAPSVFAQGPDVSYTFVTETASVAPGTTVRAVVTFNLGDNWHVNAHKPLDQFLIPTAVTLDDHVAVSVESTIYPEHTLFNVAGDDLAVYEHEFSIGMVLEISEDAPAGELSLPGTLRFQACNDKMCMPPDNLDLNFSLIIGEAGAPVDSAHFSDVAWPEADKSEDSAPTPENDATTAPEESTGEMGWKEIAERFEVVGRAGFEDTETFIAFLDAGLSGETAPTQGSTFAGKSWGLILLLIVAGGFALNLTPCVLPLIPVNIAIIGAGTKAGSRGRGFALGGAFGVGIALVYGLLGLAVMLSFTSAFGTINATPWFNIGIAVLFVILGLGMFDVINIDFTRFQSKIGIKKNENGSFLIAFGMGAISALLAGACVAPVVISTILFAQDSYSQGNQFALALPFLLGVGMALPWPFVGGGLSVLPKPGMWMVRVKQAFGIFIFAFAIYYGYIAYGLLQAGTSEEHGSHEGWHTSLQSGLAEAAETGQPVFLDFWATWCKNCLVMDDTVLKDEAVVQKLESFVKIKYQAERMDQSPTSDIIDHYEVLGLPAYLILQPK
jgi:thioredoxin:protein disulfide reductase